MVGMYYGVAVSCNVCGKACGVSSYDAGRYNQPGQEGYTADLNNRAVAKSVKNGWIRIERVIHNAEYPNGVYHNDIHICLDCQDNMEAAKEVNALSKAKRKRNKKLM
jgi:hypothetical protein